MMKKEKLEYKINIDTATKNEKKVSLVKIKNGKEEIVSERKGDIDLVPSIKEIIEENNLKIEDISEVVPNLGPGSFTGLKMGVTVANVINWVNGKKIEDLAQPEYGAEPNIS